jgi:hypothetical protein
MRAAPKTTWIKLHYCDLYIINYLRCKFVFEHSIPLLCSPLNLNMPDHKTPASTIALLNGPKGRSVTASGISNTRDHLEIQSG